MRRHAKDGVVKGEKQSIGGLEVRISSSILKAPPSELAVE